jgi:glycine cleavage system H protein
LTNRPDHIPDGLHYTREHQWLRVDGDTAKVGITGYAQHELGEIIDVALPAPGTQLSAGQKFGEVESMKVASEVFAPAVGEVTQANPALRDSPELINKDPYGEGWLIELRLSDAATPGLLTPDEYREFVRKEEEG